MTYNNIVPAQPKQKWQERKLKGTPREYSQTAV